jgi:hypothetical protein
MDSKIELIAWKASRSLIGFNPWGIAPVAQEFDRNLRRFVQSAEDLARTLVKLTWMFRAHLA